jgi:hypothetical protein
MKFILKKIQTIFLFERNFKESIQNYLKIKKQIYRLKEINFID